MFLPLWSIPKYSHDFWFYCLVFSRYPVFLAFKYVCYKLWLCHGCFLRWSKCLCWVFKTASVSTSHKFWHQVLLFKFWENVNAGADVSFCRHFSFLQGSSDYSSILLHSSSFKQKVNWFQSFTGCDLNIPQNSLAHVKFFLVSAATYLIFLVKPVIVWFCYSVHLPALLASLM